MKTIPLTLLLALPFLALGACEKKSPAEEAAEEVGDAIEETGDAIEEATD